tara:strand:- start:193 stop:417 length:225 start_codon:yes stop_codon:yes gene_type:complete
MKAVQEGQSLVPAREGDPPAREESSGRAQARYASYLAFNFGASIATIFLGKARRPAVTLALNLARRLALQPPQF